MIKEDINISFNVVNPYQLFRDSNGIPRAGGFISFFNNRTAVLGSIWSDEDLEVAQSNPYELDGYGRIKGDVKFTGLMTIQESNFDGSDVITTDDVTSSDALTLFRGTLTKTAVYSVQAIDDGLTIYASGTFDIDLLAAAAAGDGFKLSVRNDGTGVITLDPNGAETINGLTTITLNPGDWAIITCNGTTHFAVLIRDPSAVTNFLRGHVVFVDDDMGAADSAFSVSSFLTVATWESIGPTTGGSPDNTWGALDVVSANAKWIEILIKIEVFGSTTAQLYSSFLKGRKGGSSSSGVNFAGAEFTNRSGSQERDLNITTFKIPVDADNVFDLQYSEGGTAATASITIDLIGWGE